MAILYIVFGLVVVISLWQLLVWLFEIRDKNRKYRAASEAAKARNKPLLVIGGPWGGKKYRHWINKPAHGSGDVCLDIDPNAIIGHPRGVIASVTDIPFDEKVFGAVFASHILEHLPNVDDGKKALNEMDRVADSVYLVYPSRQSIGGWITKGHHLWIWQKNYTTFLKQRGKTNGLKEYQYRMSNQDAG